MSSPTFSELLNASKSVDNIGSEPAPGLSCLMDANGQPLTVITASGCTAAAYKDSSDNIIVAFQGTSTQSQFAADLQIVRGQSSSAVFNDALSFTREVEAAASAGGIKNVYVTGHSLGGTLAEYVASKAGLGGAAFAGSGVPGYSAPAVRASNFTSFVETGDPWGNLASDTAEKALVSHADHVGQVSMLGSLIASQSVAAIVRDVQALAPAAFFGHLPQAMQTLAGDWLNGMGSYHGISVYTADIGKVGLLPCHIAQS